MNWTEIMNHEMFDLCADLRHCDANDILNTHFECDDFFDELDELQMRKWNLLEILGEKQKNNTTISELLLELSKMYNRETGKKIEENNDNDSDKEEEVYTCDTCGYDLDMDDLIHGYHDQSVYQCAECFDKDKKEDEEEDESGWFYACKACKVEADLRELPKCEYYDYCCECCWKQEGGNNTCDCPVCVANPKPE